MDARILKSVVEFNKKLNPYGFEVNNGIKFCNDRIENIGNNYFFIYNTDCNVNGSINSSKLDKFLRSIKSKEVSIEQKEDSLLFNSGRVGLQIGKFPTIDYDGSIGGDLLCTFTKKERKHLELLLSIISKDKAINPSFSGITITSNNGNLSLYTTDAIRLARYIKDGVSLDIELVISKFFFEALIYSLRVFDYIDILWNDGLIIAKNDGVIFGTSAMAVDIFDFDEHFSSFESYVDVVLDDNNKDVISTISKYSNGVLHFIANDVLTVASHNDTNPTDIMTGECSAIVNDPYSKVFNLQGIVKYLDLFNNLILSDHLILDSDNLTVLLTEQE